MNGQPHSQSAASTLVLSSGSEIKEGSTALLQQLLPLLLCIFLCGGVCVCVSVCVCMCMQILGLSYLEANAQHSIMWTSQQQCRTEEKQHPLIDGPLEEQTWINGREEPFCFFNLLYLVPSSKRAKGLSSLSSAILLSPAWCPLPSSLPSLFNPPLTFFLRLLLEY